MSAYANGARSIMRPSHAMRQAVRVDTTCERCACAVKWNQRRYVRDPATGAPQAICRKCKATDPGV